MSVLAGTNFFTVQDKGNALLFPSMPKEHGDGVIHCRERLGGLLKYYYREAA